MATNQTVKGGQNRRFGYFVSETRHSDAAAKTIYLILPRRVRGRKHITLTSQPPDTENSFEGRWKKHLKSLSKTVI